MTKAKVWLYINGAYVRVTLREGEPVEYREGGPHDEGFHYEYHSIVLKDGKVYASVDTSSRDCDGPLYTSGKFVSDIPRESTVFLQEEWGEVPEFRLNWERLEGSQRDVFAEAMGY